MQKAAAFFIFISLLINVDNILFFISFLKFISKFNQLFSELRIIFFIKVAHNCLIVFNSFSFDCFLDNSNIN
jgi:hypothetical protein